MINDLPKCAVTMHMVLYADDGKVVGKASSLQDCEFNQNDLDAIYNWSVINQLPLCQPKSQCLYIGHKNGRHTYMLGGASILAVAECTDLGVIRISDFSYATHIRSVVRKTSRLSGMLFRAFSSRNVSFIITLYIEYVRPIIEYASTVCNSSSIGLNREVERVQRKLTKRLRDYCDLSYEERLASTRLITLQERLRHADLVIAFKSLHGAIAVD